jgi:hypothetical protein
MALAGAANDVVLRVCEELVWGFLKLLRPSTEAMSIMQQLQRRVVVII